MNNASDMHNDISSPCDVAIGDILGIVTCLQILNDVDDFNKWIQFYHELSPNHRLFEGYKLTIETLIRMLYQEISNNQSLRLSEDRLFARAAFTGISPHKLPNSCEKNIVLRNISCKAEPVVKAPGWDCLKESLNGFQHEVMSPLYLMKSIGVVPPCHPSLDKEAAVRYAAMFQAYISLNDTSRGFPHGYHLPVLKGDPVSPWSWKFARKRRSRFAQILDGYKYGVQFLWYRMLGDTFTGTPLARLHHATNWSEFDGFFELIQTEVIRPLEEELQADSHGSFFDSLLVLKEPAKTLIATLTTDGPPEHQLSQKDSLERFFLWYDIHLVDGSDFNFAGVAAFIPMLIGLVELRQKLGMEGNVQVIRLIHRSPIEHRRDYSYAVLVELGGFMSDASGWILFYDCCSDAGSSSLLFEQAEEFVRKYREDDLVSVTTRRVGKDRFLTLMKHRLTSLTVEQIYHLRHKE